MSLPIYMDHHATTPIASDVLDAMLPYFGTHFGNAASRTHAFGWRAEEAVEKAREQVAQSMGATAREIVFTSGATESNNLALFGVVDAFGTQKKVHVITQATEHKSVLDPCERLQAMGHHVTVLGVDRLGRVDPQAVADAVTHDTVLVSVMLVNNEVGTIQRVAEIAAHCKLRNVICHTDATQAMGVMPVDVQALGVGLLSMSAHKIYGPKGVGALFVKRKDPRVTLLPQMYGGGHERGLRSGTLNVPGIVGLGAACARLHDLRLHSCEMARLRNMLEALILDGVDGVVRYGDPGDCHPGNLCLGFERVNGEMLVLALHDVALSTGSACTSRDLAPSHVLRAMGVEPRAALGNLRFGLGYSTTQQDIEQVAQRVIDQVKILRQRGVKS